MSLLRSWASRLLAFFRKQSSNEALDAELQTHLQFLTDKHRRNGMSLRDASASGYSAVSRFCRKMRR